MINPFDEAFDSIVYKFWDDPGSIVSQDVKTKILFDNLKRKIQKSKNKRKCLVQGCNHYTVRKSHCISEKLFLKPISENGIVLTPIFDYTKGEIELVERGIGIASTFPGFCEEHEKIFLCFERNGKFSVDNHLRLQLYRNICREYYEKMFQKEIFQLLIEAYLSSRKDCFLNVFKNDHWGKLIELLGAKIKSIEYSGKDDIEESTNSRMKEVDRAVAEITEYYEKGQYLLTNDDSFVTVSVSIDEIVPVCLSGRANLQFLENESFKNITLFINILPVNNETIVSFSSLAENENYIRLYLDQVLIDSESYIRMIETLMVRGSDHWFIKPSIWINIEQSRKEKILSDILDLKFNIGTVYQTMIFDELRKNNCG